MIPYGTWPPAEQLMTLQAASRRRPPRTDCYQLFLKSYTSTVHGCWWPRCVSRPDRCCRVLRWREAAIAGALAFEKHTVNTALLPAGRALTHLCVAPARRVTGVLAGALSAQQRQFHGSQSAGDAVDVVNAFSVCAAPAEPLMMMLNPLVVATQAWEAMHAATGLPWWASIPITTLALRGLLMPLTIKAKGATVNFALMQQASTSTAALTQQFQGDTPAGAASSSGGSSSSTGKAAAATKPSQLEQLKLAAHYYRYLRRQHRTPSLWWYNLNVFAQVGASPGRVCVWVCVYVCVHAYVCVVLCVCGWGREGS